MHVGCQHAKELKQHFHPSPIVKMMPHFFSFGAFCLFSLLFAYLSSFRASNDDWRARPGHS